MKIRNHGGGAPGSLRRLTGLALALLLAGCAGIDSSKPDIPDGGRTGACSSGPAVLTTPFHSGFGAVGTDTTLEVGCWNLLNFPSDGSTTVQLYTNILQTVNLDILGVEEIGDTTAFRTLVNNLPGYGGVYSPDAGWGFYQKTGFIWRRSLATLESWGVPAAFDSSQYHFPDDYYEEDGDAQMDVASGQTVWAGRPPLEGVFRVQSPRRSLTFHLIVMHLKAGTWEADSQARRRCATYVLHRYVDAQVSRDPTVKYVLVGDWNDLLTDLPLETNTFRAFLEDPENYEFLTQSLVGVAGMVSHPNGLIDHILVNVNACPDFSAGRITILPLKSVDIPPYPTNYYNEYGSDHVPVVAIVPGF
jgi:hypothetical protein